MSHPIATTVLFVDHTGVMGGAQHSLLDIAEANRDRCAIALLEDGPYATALAERGVRVILVRGGGALREIKKTSALPGVGAVAAAMSLAWKLAQIARPYGVLYANSPKSFLVAALAGTIARKPVIWHLRDILGDGHFSAANVRAVVTAANWRAVRVVANSHATADAFVRAGGRRDLVRVVHNGIDPAPFDALTPGVRAAVRAELGIAADAFLVGCFSRLHPWKGQTVLLDAIARMPNAHALIVGGALFSGEAPYEAELRARAELPSFAGRVHMLGARDDVPRLLAACDVVVHASVLAEPFGRVLVEAMLAGRPVVATRAGGVPEVVTDGETGILVPPGDARALTEALDALRRDPARVAQLARRGATHARSAFSRDAMLAGVTGVLAEVTEVRRVS
ncbi:MAG TPA: glycosyltransferase family 4 protein [Gemmatimonadaceae bacterium]|jgi:glycosyltransferase involved in cell wall biosynthesis|nr:glycosyltransferase family 4 protein [Gemmatimonadaceae bacterium]